VKNKRLYNIAVNGLPAGIQTYSFELGDVFFADFENSEIQHGQLQAGVSVEKKNNFLQLSVHIDGSVTTPCDRCLDDLSLPVRFQAAPTVEFTDGSSDESLTRDDDTLWVTDGSNELDMAPYLYDSIILSLPLRRVHPEGTCNREMAERLKEMSSEQK
jgi:uncharacterized metal-binding protein YceD (DUF177 family)